MTPAMPAADRTATMRLVVSVPGLLPTSSVASGETVLVALEDDRQRNWLAATLRHRGYRVVTARHAGHALLQTLRFVGPIDVVVTGAALGDMSGAELEARVCAHSAARFVRATEPFSTQALLREVQRSRPNEVHHCSTSELEKS